MVDEGALFFLIFTGVWSFVGVVFLCVGIALRRRLRRKKERCAQLAQGTVTELVQQGALKYPVAAYTVYGQTYTVRGQLGYLDPPVAVNDAVDVFYNGDDPAEGTLAGLSPLLIVSTVFLSVGIGAILLGWGIGLTVRSFAF